ncbi:galactosyltransferase-related protein [Alkalihalobacterium alkalinitrilicum]|uniref:galactosyltransferase-related protein n=1 Tax=Alkalihalobacterium alkalinitrilicum TaxID=427920 RepID=UPI001EE3D126|nr:galactosyltransferase-related protein [Alkalihalobacterium alkalinitrilicum]
MLKNVSVLIPYKPDNGLRDQLLAWVITFYKNVLPKIEICIGENHDDLFSRAQAINNAAKKATKDIFVIADGDIVYNPQVIKRSIQLLEKYAWVIPYKKCLDLTEDSTNKLLKKPPHWPLPKEIEYTERFKDDTKYQSVGGFTILSRKNFNSVGGFDERFKGWGGEDDAFKHAMDTICGPHKRIEDEFIYHLWHPKVGGKKNPNIEKNRHFIRRYASCNGNIEKMKTLINKRKSMG